MKITRFKIVIEDATPEQLAMIASACKRAEAKGGPITTKDGDDPPEDNGPGGPG